MFTEHLPYAKSSIMKKTEVNPAVVHLSVYREKETINR